MTSRSPIAVGDTVMPGDRAGRSSTSGGRRGRGRRGRRADDRPRRTCAPTSPRCSNGTTSGSTHRRPDAVARRRDDRPAHGTRERRRPRRRRHLRRVRAARRRRAAPAPLARGAHRAHAGRRAGRRHRHASTASRRSRCPTTTRCSPARRACWNHAKKDRLFELAERLRLPVVFFTEGGGGRPGDTDGIGRRRPRLPGVPLLRAAERAGAARRHRVGLLLRRQRRASSAAATSSSRPTDSNIGMGGPAMIEGGGLGVFEPDDDRPDRRAGRRTASSTSRSPTRPRRSRVAKQYLVVLRRAAPTTWECADQRTLRHVIPENRLRAYDVRTVVDALADTGSVLELRRGVRHGHGHRARAHRGPAARHRRQQPVAPRRRHRRDARRQGGALPAALRRVRPAGLFLCDTPGFMVGPEAETTARGAARVAHVRDGRQPHGAVRHDRAAQGLRPRRAGDGGRHVQGAAVQRRRGRRASSAAWASRAPCGSASARELEAIDDPDERERDVPGDGRAHVRARQGASTWRATSRSTT